MREEAPAARMTPANEGESGTLNIILAENFYSTAEARRRGEIK
jgi:hypothetical protein